MKCQQIIFKILSIFIISLFFLGCSDSKEEKTQIEQLVIPEMNEAIIQQTSLKFSDYLSAKKDPIAATKIGYAYSEKLQDYNKALQWYKYSNSMKPLPENSNYACYALQQLKQYDKAIPWCQEAIKLGSDEALFQLATTYFKINDYEKSLEWFLKAYEKGNKDASNNIGLNYVKLKKYNDAKKWYETAIKEKNLDAYANMSNLYLDFLNDDVKGAAYAIALINTKYTQSSVLNVLINEEKLSNDIIQKGYELQLNSKEFPVKFKGELDLE